MFVTVELLERLRHLTADPDRADALATALAGLCAGVVVAVPSWTSVSIMLRPPGNAEVELSMVASAEQDSAHVLSSLAVPLSDLHPGDHLIVRARAAGAFILLADELASRLGRGRRILVDQHLDLPPNGEAAAAVFAIRSVFDQAIGVLIERGLAPVQARQYLERRAHTSGTSVAAAARSLLETVVGPRDQDQMDSDLHSA